MARRVGAIARTPEAAAALLREYDRLIALVQTPEGTITFLREYAQAAPAGAAELVREWRAWLQRIDPALAAQLAAFEVPGE